MADQNQFALSDITTDFTEFKNQFNNTLATQETWVGTLTTQTSQALVDMISTIGSFNTSKILRYYEDAFPDTAESDGAIRAIAVMQGLRLTRMLPAVVPCILRSTAGITLPPYTQFNINGNQFFSRVQITLVPGVDLNVELYEGAVKVYTVQGLGENLQAFMSDEDDFVVSDQDTTVVINGEIIPKAFGGLWNYENRSAYSDMTNNDGRLMVMFGSGIYGSIPSVTDVVSVLYVVTRGGDGNGLITVNKGVIANGLSSVTGECLSNPTGGANDKDTLAYKNVESGAFGTYSSAVTKAQYNAIINTYPGVVDAITQAQREINPMDPKWMNIFRVAALTTSPWTQSQKRAFCDYAQDVTMYAGYFLWQDPVAIPRDVDMTVYVFNTAVPSQIEELVIDAIIKMFAPHPGLLMLNYYESDLIQTAMNAAKGQISYVKVNSPIEDMVVTAPESPLATYEIDPGAGTLDPRVYAYGISTIMPNGEEGTADNWVFPQVISSGDNASVTLTWQAIKGAAQYKIWGRAAGPGMGLLATVNAPTTTFIDTGAITPVVQPLPTLADFPIRHNSLRTIVVKAEFADRQIQVQS